MHNIIPGIEALHPFLQACMLLTSWGLIKNTHEHRYSATVTIDAMSVWRALHVWHTLLRTTYDCGDARIRSGIDEDGPERRVMGLTMGDKSLPRSTSVSVWTKRCVRICQYPYFPCPGKQLQVLLLGVEWVRHFVSSQPS